MNTANPFAAHPPVRPRPIWRRCIGCEHWVNARIRAACSPACAGPSEDGQLLWVLALIAVGLIATLGLVGAAHEVVHLIAAGWHALVTWVSRRRSSQS